MGSIARDKWARTPADVAPLEKWITMPQAAAILGLTKQSVYRLVFETGEIEHVRRIGDGKHVVYVLYSPEIEAVGVARRQAEELAARLEDKRERIMTPNLKLREWAWEHGCPQLSGTGRIPAEVRDADDAAHATT